MPMVFAEVILLAVAGALLICGSLAGAPRSFRDRPRPVLICVAHSDDCVIVGAEYAYGAIRESLPVSVLYLTCSGPSPESEISNIRRQEAIAAWSAADVPESDLHFMDLKESPVPGPANYSDEDVASARDFLTGQILALPGDAALIVPAEGESHIDHRTVRAVALEAAELSRRQDLVIYEVPEYNSFLSLTLCPRRAVHTMLRAVPGMNRLLAPFAGPANYVRGRPGFVFRGDPNRLGEKRRLLRYFRSQDEDLLVRLFGYRTPYRKLSLSDLRRATDPKFQFHAFKHQCDISILALGISILALSFLIAWQVAALLTASFPSIYLDMALFVIGAVVGAVYLIRCIRRRVALETCLFVWLVALGLMTNSLMNWNA
jgi:LmbE family N-acetylglucosaminyl deacetylase